MIDMIEQLFIMKNYNDTTDIDRVFKLYNKHTVRLGQWKITIKMLFFFKRKRPGKYIKKQIETFKYINEGKWFVLTGLVINVTKRLFL